MPLIDMPIERLLEYGGTNPRPADHDVYWEQAIAEMKATDACVQLIPADFRVDCAECYDMYFTGTHGARIYVKHLRPRNVQGRIPAVLLFHGYTGHSGDWWSKLAYVAQGFAVFAMDVRGQGGKSSDVGGVAGNTLHGHIIRGLSDDDPHKLLFRDIFLDTAQLAGLVMDMDFIDGQRVYATGASQGGALTIACAALEPRIAKAAPMYPFLCDYRRVWEMDLAESAYRELKDYFRWYDPRHEREEEIFTKLGYIDLQYLAPRIRGEVLMFTGLMDTVCPPSTQFSAYNKMTCPKSYVLYPDFAHEWLPGADDRIFRFLTEEQ